MSKNEKEFDFSKDPISNLINSILRSMEDIQWNMSHLTVREGGKRTTALRLLTQCENRILIPETEKQILADRERLNYNFDVNPIIQTQEVQPMINRFNQYLAKSIFADRKGLHWQNPRPTHISEETQIGSSPIYEENPDVDPIG